MNSPRAVGALALLLLQGLAVGLYFFIEGRQPSREEPFRYETLSRTTPAPELLLEREETSLQLSALKGRFVLVHFWATWCEPCREELPALLKLVRGLPQRERVTLLAISEDQDWETVREYFSGQIPAEVVWDASGTGGERYEVSALPDTYLIDPQGRLMLRFGGARDWSSPAAKALLRRVLEQP